MQGVLHWLVAYQVWAIIISRWIHVYIVTTRNKSREVYVLNTLITYPRGVSISALYSMHSLFLCCVVVGIRAALYISGKVHTHYVPV